VAGVGSLPLRQAAGTLLAMPVQRIVGGKIPRNDNFS